MKVDLITRDRHAHTGLSRYSQELYATFQAQGIDVVLSEPTPTFLPSWGVKLAKRLGMDVLTFFRSYPFTARYRAGAIKHLTSQSLATLLALPMGKPVIVTVHDIIPYMLRNDPVLSHYQHGIEAKMDSLALHRLHRADFLLSDSHYSKAMLIEHLGLPADRIEVVHLGVDHTIFYPVDDRMAARAKYSFRDDKRYLLYVGAETPRKNLERLIRAFALIADSEPDVQLVKMGASQVTAERDQLKAFIADLKLTDRVIFIDRVSDEGLRELYNAADLLVLPSLYEGFGFPALEAMACGTPVAATNQSSVPEIVGDAAVQFDPYDIEAIADALRLGLNDQARRTTMRAQGLERAREFTWRRTAEQTLAVYRKVAV